VAQYLEALNAQDWRRLRSTLADDRFERVGPFCDIIGSADEYVQFLDRVVSGLSHYRVDIRRTVEGNRTVYVEATESFRHDGTNMEFPEVLVFDTGDDSITRVQVYMMRPGDEPSVAGAKA
jgi:limonene-1,2-epoxide hydrolase